MNMIRREEENEEEQMGERRSREKLKENLVK